MEYKQLKEIFCRNECAHPGTHLTAYITFASFGPDNNTEYLWKSRTYLVSSDNKAFQPNKGGYSIFGSCLDGSDQGIRLEQYMKDECGGKDGWGVEDCAIVGYLLIKCSACNISVPKLFYTRCDALNCMLSQLSELGELDAGKLKKDFAAAKEVFEEDCYRADLGSAWLADPCADWHWKIQPVCIYGPTNIRFPDQEGEDNKVFDRHCDVHDGDGNPYPALPDSTKPIAVPETAQGPLPPCTPEVVVMDADRIYALSPADTAELNVRFPRVDWGEYFWGFTCFSRQDYTKVVPPDGVDEIMLGIQCVQGGCLCEMAIRWHMISNKPTPRLEMFDTASALCWSTSTEETGKINKLLTMLLEQLSQQPRSFDTADNPGFWSDGEMILCPSEAECEFTANFLRDLFRDSSMTVTTGYFDPFQDHNNGEGDDYTGFYSISFE